MEFSSQVKDATEAIQQLPPFFDAIMNLMRTPAGWAVILIFFFWLLVNKDFVRVFSFFEKRENRRLEHFDLYLAKPEIADSESVKVLQDLRDAYYFKIATGIYAEKQRRRALIDLHKKMSHHVSWNKIRRASSYIVVDRAGKVTIRNQSVFEAIGYRYNQFVACLSLFAGAGIFSIFLFSNSKTFTSLALCVGTSFPIIVFAMFVFSQNWPELAAKHLKKELETFNHSFEECTLALSACTSPLQDPLSN